MIFLAQVQEEFVNNEIRWLQIETDEEDTGGCFIYYQKTKEDDNAHDTWHLSLDEAYRVAKEQYGIDKNQFAQIAE